MQNPKKKHSIVYWNENLIEYLKIVLGYVVFKSRFDTSN